MTSSGGAGRPAPDVDGSETRADPPGSGPAQQDRPGEGGGESRTADVAAALRAQASRAAQASREAAGKVPGAGRDRGQDRDPKDQQSGQAASAPAAPAPSPPYATGPGPATAASPAARPPADRPSGDRQPHQTRTPEEKGRPPAAAAPTATMAAAASGGAGRRPAPVPPRRPGRVRKARLRVLRLDPWSVMKTAFLLSVAAGIMIVVAVAVLWSVLDAAGVFSTVGDVVRDVTATEAGGGFQIDDYLALTRILGFTTLIAVVDVVLITALATLAAFLYNLSASLLGGLEVTLAEDE